MMHQSGAVVRGSKARASSLSGPRTSSALPIRPAGSSTNQHATSSTPNCSSRAIPHARRRAPAPAAAAPRRALDTAPTLEAALAGPQVRHYIRPQAPWPTDVPISILNLDAGAAAPNFDLVVAGAGPSGLAIGARVAEAGYSVAVIDPEPLGIWPNNYGVWVDEFQSMGLEDCLEVIWPKAKVWLDNDTTGQSNLGEK